MGHVFTWHEAINVCVYAGGGLHLSCVCGQVVVVVGGCGRYKAMFSPGMKQKVCVHAVGRGGAGWGGGF